MKKIAIFASGAGSNATKIIERFQKSETIQVSLIVSNKTGAGILQIAEENKIPTLIIDKEKFFEGNGYVAELKEKEIDLIVLAGFLWKIPDSLIQAFPQHIINIHPALLPKYGGKGMYGRFVHQAVIDNKENESGITIHYVDGHYDNGDVISQASCPVLENDTADTLAKRVQALEHEHYPKEIERLLNK
jgi:phosphoribosylglycinamide formyltransferase-1